MKNPVSWFEIYVEDMPRARKFYEAMLDVTLSKLDNNLLEMWAFEMTTDDYGAGGALCKMEGIKPKVGGTLVYFSCDDCAVNAEKAKAAGGKIQQPKFSIGEHGFISMIEDSEGNTIGLHSMQ